MAHTQALPAPTHQPKLKYNPPLSPPNTPPSTTEGLPWLSSPTTRPAPPIPSGTSQSRHPSSPPPTESSAALSDSAISPSRSQPAPTSLEIPPVERHTQLPQQQQTPTPTTTPTSTTGPSSGTPSSASPLTQSRGQPQSPPGSATVREGSPVPPVPAPAPAPTAQPASPSKSVPSKAISPAPVQIEEDTPVVDMDVFSQILELDEDDYDFSKPMVDAYLEQVVETLDKMEKALRKRDLNELADLGHFLKGSSAALGVERLQRTCEKMQHWGYLHLAADGDEIPRDQAISWIEQLLPVVRTEYNAVNDYFEDYYA